MAGVASCLNVALRGIWKWAISWTSGSTPWVAKSKEEEIRTDAGKVKGVGAAECGGDALSVPLLR